MCHQILILQIFSRLVQLYYLCTHKSEPSNLHIAKLSKPGMKAAVKQITPDARDVNSRTGFLPKVSAARPQNGAVIITPVKRLRFTSIQARVALLPVVCGYHSLETPKKIDLY